jgi:hypothetical protein
MIFLLILGFSFSNSASARVASPCSVSYGEDSTGLGIYDAVKGGRFTHAKDFSQGCYDLGVQEGGSYAACRSGAQFDTGVNAGLAFVNAGVTDTCYQLGYRVGVNLLHVQAREGRADASCNRFYNQGISDAASQISNYNGNSDKEAECYHTGFSDFAFLR